MEKVVTRFEVSQAAHDRFAGLSGDWNRIHGDGIAAKRSAFGQPIAHGINAAMTALERLGDQLAAHTPKTLSLQFLKPLFIGEAVSLVVAASDGKRMRLSVRAGHTDLIKIAIGFIDANRKSAPARLNTTSRSAPPRREPNGRKINDGAGLTIEMPLTVDAVALHAAFPHLIGWLGERCVAGIVLLSTAVGMEWPGATSLFTEAKLTFATGEPAASKNPSDRILLAVDRIRPELNYTTMQVTAPDFIADVGAFFTPPPIAPPTFEYLRNRVSPGIFDSWTTIVVGGSRGLGATAAKLMAVGGAAIILTYRESEAEAAEVRDDIVSNGGHCTIIRYDAVGGALHLPENTSPAGKVLLFYAASPRIFRRRREMFVRGWLDEFLAIYVDGFLAVTQAVMAWTDGPISIFYPSTQALDEPVNDLLEYAAAKSAGEMLCLALAKEDRLTAIAPRLPRMLTDQTNTVVQTNVIDSVGILLPLIVQLTAK